MLVILVQLNGEARALMTTVLLLVLHIRRYLYFFWFILSHIVPTLKMYGPQEGRYTFHFESH